MTATRGTLGPDGTKYQNAGLSPLAGLENGPDDAVCSTAPTSWTSNPKSASPTAIAYEVVAVNHTDAINANATAAIDERIGRNTDVADRGSA